MLIEFRVKNFKSFRDEQVLSMVASSDTSLMENTVVEHSFGNRGLLKSMVVYGANASGKSNLIDAFAALRDAIIWEKNPLLERLHINDNRLHWVAHSFRFSNERSKAPCEFEIIFTHESVRYQYSIWLNSERIISESLIAYPKGSPQIWYERQWQHAHREYQWQFGRHLKGEKNQLTTLTRSDVSFLAIGAQFNNVQLASVYKWFAQNLKPIYANYYGETNPGDIFEAPMYAVRLTEDREFRKKVQGILQSADVGIVGIEAERDSYQYGTDSDGSIEGYKVKFVHRGADNASRKAIRVQFELGAESLGTRKLLDLACEWVSALEMGKVLVVDELDARLHPILCRELIRMIHNPNTNLRCAQLIFNTHNTILLDSTLFRRDQIWFTEKDADGASHLYSLLDYGPRKGESLQKGYLQGRYGAIPIIGSSLLGLDIDEKTPKATPATA